MYDASHWRGSLRHIHIAPAASYEMEALQEARLVAGRGIEGDRYFLGIGTYSKLPAVREVGERLGAALVRRWFSAPTEPMAMSGRLG